MRGAANGGGFDQLFEKILQKEEADLDRLVEKPPEKRKPSRPRTDWKVEKGRLAKGRLIASMPGAIERVRDDIFLVKSQSGPGSHRVSLTEKGPECSCPDFASRGLPCKHVASVAFYLEKQTTLPSGTTISEKVPLTYKQAWSAYDRAQTEELRLFDLLLKDLATLVPEPVRDLSKGGRPAVPLSEQIFCAVRKVYSQLSCRRSRGLFGFAADRGILSKTRHYTISSEFLTRPEVTPILERLVTLSALPCAALEEGFAVDSTGMQSTSFGAWREAKHGESREHVWLKAHALGGVRTHVIAAIVVTDKNGADNPQFERLIRMAAEAGIDLRTIFGDKAYSAGSSYSLAEEFTFELLVPFKSNAKGRMMKAHNGSGPLAKRPHSSLWRKAFLYFLMHRDEFEARYHRRSNIESVFSALKRKFGETLKSKNETSQVNELLAKALAYNITVLIHEIFEHGVIPDFLSPATLGTINN